MTALLGGTLQEDRDHEVLFFTVLLEPRTVLTKLQQLFQCFLNNHESECVNA